MLYLESGNIPIRFILKARRLNFLWYILNEDEDSLIHSFFKAQCNKPVRGDWVNTVRKDLEDLDIDMDFQSIKSTSKAVFKTLIKNKIKTKAFNDLVEVQQTHSKSVNVNYSEFKLQEYLSPNNEMTIKQKSFLFAARTHMIDLKANFKQGKSDLLCRICRIEEEDQSHLLSCQALCDGSLIKDGNLPTYEDLYSENSLNVETIGRILMQKYQLFKTTMCTYNSGAADNNGATNIGPCNLLSDLD